MSLSEEQKKAVSSLMEIAVETLASLEHDQWAHWMKYLDSQKRGRSERGHIVFHRNKWNRWLKQVETPYAQLSEKEKESDRVWARKVLAKLGLTEKAVADEFLRSQLQRGNVSV